MGFFEKNFSYIKECAECRAREITNLLNTKDDFQDYVQDIYIWVMKRADKYDPQRSKPTTYIAMITQTAKKRIIRKCLRKKNRILSDAKRF